MKVQAGAGSRQQSLTRWCRLPYRALWNAAAKSHEEGRFMGLIWNLIQHGQITENRSRSETIERRLERLEDELHRTNESLISLMKALEVRFGDDLDGDGRVG
jgi:hypothetical protein